MVCDRLGVGLERDVGPCADIVGRTEILLAEVRFVGGDFPDREVGGGGLYERNSRGRTPLNTPRKKHHHLYGPGMDF